MSPLPYHTHPLLSCLRQTKRAPKGNKAPMSQGLQTKWKRTLYTRDPPLLATFKRIGIITRAEMSIIKHSRTSASPSRPSHTKDIGLNSGTFHHKRNRPERTANMSRPRKTTHQQCAHVKKYGCRSTHAANLCATDELYQYPLL